MHNELPFSNSSLRTISHTIRRTLHLVPSVITITPAGTWYEASLIHSHPNNQNEVLEHIVAKLQRTILPRDAISTTTDIAAYAQLFEQAQQLRQVLYLYNTASEANITIAAQNEGVVVHEHITYTSNGTTNQKPVARTYKDPEQHLKRLLCALE